MSPTPAPRSAPGPPDPRGTVVRRVIEAELRRRDARGIVLAAPDAPEGSLLARWLEGRGTVERPDAPTVAAVAAALGLAPDDRIAWRAAADARGRREGLLPVDPRNRTALLLDPAPRCARVLPLADVWASEVRDEVGSATLPPVLQGADDAALRAVETALGAWLEDGHAPSRALAPLGDLAPRVRDALDAAAPARSGPLAPKLRGWTPGIDLDRG